MSEQEKIIVNSIASKIQIFINDNNLTILGFSKLLKIDKQPLYRIMKREHIPNILFLEAIASQLHCTVAELIDEKYFFDVNVYNNYDIVKSHNYEVYRVYINDQNFLDIVNNSFFGVINNTQIEVFFETDKLLNDGCYLIDTAQNQLELINIIGVGATLAIALIDGKEVRLNPINMKVIAKLYKKLPISASKEYIIKKC